MGRDACNYECAIQKVKQDREKKRKNEWQKEKKELKEKLKTRRDYLKETQKIFNDYIRLRDKDLPCISCGRKNLVKQNAGHFRSVGSCPELRFEPLNCHLQCEHCNSYLSGNILEYRKGLTKKIGCDKVEWLEGPHEIKKYTIPELIEIKEKYKQKIKELKEAG